MPIPAKIGRYRIESELGRGGMAVVYLAYDPRFNRKVAVKVLPPGMLRDARARALFEREIKTAAGLEHPAIVPVYDAGEDNGLPYFVMRLMSGGSLAAMSSKGKIPLEETAQIISKIAQGLSYAHKRGVVHRDLKPHNILFDENKNPFIADFGVARALELTGRSLGAGMGGTPVYMSPEQAQGGEVDNRSDIYSLGFILYEMLSGRLPYKDAPAKAFAKPLPDISSLDPALPPQVDSVIRRAAAREKSARYADALELAKDLHAAAFGAAEKFVDVAPIAEKPAASRFGAGLLLAALIFGVLAAGVFLLRSQLFVSRQPAADVSPVVVTVPPTQPLSESPTLLPTATVFAPTIEPAPLSLAPVCAGELSIPTPTARETNKICVEKKPYTAVSIPQGAAFESLSPAMSCIEEATSGGKTVISCTGQQLYSYQLKVCSPLPVLEPDSDKCGGSMSYDPAHRCCRPAPAPDSGCILFKVDLKACR